MKLDVDYDWDDTHLEHEYKLDKIFDLYLEIARKEGSRHPFANVSGGLKAIIEHTYNLLTQHPQAFKEFDFFLDRVLKDAKQEFEELD